MEGTHDRARKSLTRFPLISAAWNLFCPLSIPLGLFSHRLFFANAHQKWQMAEEGGGGGGEERIGRATVL